MPRVSGLLRSPVAPMTDLFRRRSLGTGLKLAVGAFVAVFVLLSPERGLATPMVFDFEDGEQGWLLFNGAKREETSVLGGSFAVFGADTATLSFERDLTGIESLTLQQLWVSPVQEQTNLVTVRVFGTDANGSATTRRDRDGVSLIADAANPFPNPDLRSFDISGFVGAGSVLITWNELVCIPEDPCPFPNFVGYVDNITFHPVPEPSSSFLSAMVLALLFAGRRLFRE